MNKRRRAYKKYDWQGHCMKLLSNQLEIASFRRMVKAMDIAIMYGEDALGWKESELVIKAGMWSIAVPVQEPYRKETEEWQLTHLWQK